MSELTRMPSHNEKGRQQKLIELVREAIKRDNELREHYQVSEKFKFIREKLNVLLSTLEKNLETAHEESKEEAQQIAEDEMIVYVHLFNAKGSAFASWQNMLTPKVFYEYSVNRPIYIDKSHIEALIRTKTNKLQHAYLSIAIKKTDLLQPPSDTSPKDSINNPLSKVREGSLKFPRLLSFTHNAVEYTVDEDGMLRKK